MRLDILEHDHRLPARLFQRVAKLVLGDEVGDDGKTLMYRPRFFGRPFLDYARDVLRGPSYWSISEREYMAAFASKVNECPFCVDLHGELSRMAASAGVHVGDPESARPQLTAVLTLMAKASRTPDDVRREDVDAVRAAGVLDAAIVDALHVTLIMDTINRLANAFGWAWASEEHVRKGARAMHLSGYRLPGPVLR